MKKYLKLIMMICLISLGLTGCNVVSKVTDENIDKQLSEIFELTHGSDLFEIGKKLQSKYNKDTFCFYEGYSNDASLSQEERDSNKVFSENITLFIRYSKGQSELDVYYIHRGRMNMGDYEEVLEEARLKYKGPGVYHTLEGKVFDKLSGLILYHETPGLKWSNVIEKKYKIAKIPGTLHVYGKMGNFDEVVAPFVKKNLFKQTKQENIQEMGYQYHLTTLENSSESTEIKKVETIKSLQYKVGMDSKIYTTEECRT